MIDKEIEVIFNKRVTSDIFLMGLKAPEIVGIARPGQFVMVRISSGVDPLLRRPFSICGKGDDNLLLVLYRVVGRGTEIMSKTRKGAKLTILGPLGRGFDLSDTVQKPVLVAGGIGIAPLIFLAQTVKTGGVTFMAGYGSKSEIVTVEKFGLNATEIMIATDDGTSGHMGPVTELLEAHLTGCRLGIQTVFACGPFSMLKRVADLTVSRDIPCQVSLEASMACGLGACQACAIKAKPGQEKVYHHVCQDGPVFNVQSLNWKNR